MPQSPFSVWPGCSGSCLRPARRVRRASPTRLTDFEREHSSIRCHIPMANNTSGGQAAQTTKRAQQDLRYQLPRWMAAFVVIALIQELTTIPPTGFGLWTIPALIVIG